MRRVYDGHATYIAMLWHKGSKLRVLSILLILFLSSCTVGTSYEYDDTSDMIEDEVYSDENVVIYLRPLIGQRSLIQIFSLKDEVKIEIESVRLVVYGDGEELISIKSTVLPGSRTMNRNHNYEMERYYEVVELPKSIHGNFFINFRVNGIAYEKEQKFRMQKTDIGYFEALQSI
jgi:hypothetical protein